MKPAPTTLSDRDLVIEVCRGNPGALSTCAELIRSGRRATVERLATLGIVGPRVWLARKDLGDQTIETLARNVDENSDALVRLLTELGYAPEAV